MTKVICTGCGLPLREHEIWMDTTGSILVNSQLVTTGDVLCEYCFDNAYPIGSEPFIMDDHDIMEWDDFND